VQGTQGDLNSHKANNGFSFYYQINGLTMELKFASTTLSSGIGRHSIAELGGGCSDLLNDEDFIKETLKEAASSCGATFLSTTTHRFEPQGVTAVALLAESHITIHTWPEHGYAAVDAFTCGSHCNPEAAINHLKHSFKFTEDHIKTIDRLMPCMRWPTALVYC